MRDEYKFWLGVCICIGVMFMAEFAADVGQSREKTKQSCYEAAKVNHNIKCEFYEKGMTNDR